MVDAVLADAPVAKESGGGTEQTEVVQRLHDRHPRLMARVVNGRREIRKRVVHVHDVRPEVLKETAKSRLPPCGPDRVRCHTERVGCPGRSADLLGDQIDLTSVLLQKARLVLEDIGRGTADEAPAVAATSAPPARRPLPHAA